jgi:hypothetical protein
MWPPALSVMYYLSYMSTELFYVSVCVCVSLSLSLSLCLCLCLCVCV